MIKPISAKILRKFENSKFKNTCLSTATRDDFPPFENFSPFYGHKLIARSLKTSKNPRRKKLKKMFEEETLDKKFPPGIYFWTVTIDIGFDIPSGLFPMTWYNGAPENPQFYKNATSLFNEAQSHSKFRDFFMSLPVGYQKTLTFTFRTEGSLSLNYPESVKMIVTCTTGVCFCEFVV
jgi:hypothetical protein